MTVWGDHPRMCGEHQPFFTKMRVWQGSSPHVRGALELVYKLVVFVGIIPACAGSTALVR